MGDMPNLPKRPLFDDSSDEISLDFIATDGKGHDIFENDVASDENAKIDSNAVESFDGAIIADDVYVDSETVLDSVDDISEEVVTVSEVKDVLYNERTNEYFDSTTGFKVDVVEVEILEQSEKVVNAVSHVKTPPKLNKNVPDNIGVDEWTEDDSNDPTIGLGAEKDPKAFKTTKLGKGFAITERDIIMMRFLARYRYAYVDQIARLVNAEIKDVKARLRKLEREGLLRSEAITAGQDIFLIRKAGLTIIDMDFPEIKKGSVSFITVAHTVGLVNLAVELEMATGGKNILGEEDYPQYNRYPMGIRDFGSKPTLIGEMTVTEREIRRGSRLFRGSKTTEDMRIIAREAFEDPSGPELLDGNEGLFVVYGTGKDGEHVPDLVVARPRGENGEVRHIAIELELTPKNNSEWARILRWYRDHGFMYDKIYYFTHKRTLAESLKRVAATVGMEDKVVVRKYIPQNNRGPFWG